MANRPVFYFPNIAHIFAPMTSWNKLTQTFGKLAFLQGLNFILPFAALPVVVRIIGPDKFGVLNYLLAVQMWFVLLINYGFDISATREVTAHRENHVYINELFWNILYARIGLLLLSGIIFSGLFLALPQMREDARVSLWTLLACISFVFTPNWLFQGYEELPRAMIFTVAGKLFFCIGILLFIRHKEDYWLYAAITATTQIIAGIAVLWYSIRRYKLRPAPFRFTAVKSLLVNSRTVFLTTLLLNFFVSSNTIILGFFRDQKEVGYFTAASRIIVVVQTITLIPLSQTLFPHIGSAFKENRDAGLELLKKYFKPVLIIAIISALLVILSAPLVIHILFGPAFGSSIDLLRLFSLLTITFCLNNYLGTQAALNLHLDKPVFKILLYGAIFNIAFNIFLCRLWGNNGAAISWILTDIFIFLLLKRVLLRNNIHIYSK